MKKLWSIFTDDMDTCIFTGSNVVERHHVQTSEWRTLYPVTEKP